MPESMSKPQHTRFRTDWLKAALILSILFTVVVSVESYRLGRSAKLSGVPEPTIIAHRGLSYMAPEETREAYQLAGHSGAQFLEGDIQRTKDGVLVMFHDDDLKRTTNVADVYPERKNEGIGSFDYQELQRLDAGSWFNRAHPEMSKKSYQFSKILKFSEFLQIASEFPRMGIYLETKSPKKYPGIENHIVRELKQTGWLPDRSDRIIIQSFDLDSLKRFRIIAYDVKRVYLINEDMEREFGWSKLTDDARLYAHGVGPVGYLAGPMNIFTAHRKGLVVHFYTINKKWQMTLLRAMGADGFFTDRPDLASGE